MKMMKPVVCRTRVTNEDLIMRDHRVHKVRILPGVTYLDMILRVLAEEAIDLKELEFRQIVFQEALATSEAFDKEVRITVTPLDPYGTIVVESRKVKGEDVLDAEWSTNLRCEVHRVPASSGKRLDIRSLKERAARITDMDEAYSFTRRMQIDHYEFMKGLGSVYEHAEYQLAEVKLSELAGSYVPYFYLHPAFLDSSTLVPGLFYFRDAGMLREEDFNKPFIPLVIESFRAWESLRDESCYVYVPRSSVSLSVNDLLYSDIELYNRDGVQVAVFNRLVIKKIRSASYMRQLQEGADADRTVVQAGTSDAEANSGVAGAALAGTGESAETPELADQLRGLIGGLLGRSAEQIGVDEGFYEQGMDSGDLLRLVRMLEERLQVQLYPTLLFEYPTVTSLADYLQTEYGAGLVVLEQERRKAEVRTEAGKAEAAAATAAAQPAQVRPLLCTYDWVAEKLPEAAGSSGGQGCLLVLAADGKRLEEAVAASSSLGMTDVPFVLVKPGRRFHVHNADEFEIDPANEEHYGMLLDELEKRKRKPERIAHLWSWNDMADGSERLEEELADGIYSIAYLTKAFAARRLSVRMLYLHAAAEGLPKPHAAAFGGYAKSLVLEDPRFQYVSVELPARDSAEWALLTLRELSAPLTGGLEIRYEGGIRYVKRMVRLDRADIRPAHSHSLRPSGAYLMTGGLGGLGWMVASHLASTYQARLALVGRSAPPADWPSRLEQLRKLGGDACYIQADIAEATEATKAVAAAEAAYGTINGVIHCAGVLRDSLAASKKAGDMAAVFAPKLNGTENLDSALRGKPLDLFVLFSSLSAVTGNIGQSDYAYANAYMDHFARRRNRLAADGERSGRAVTINWPLWRSGGMQVDRSTEDAIRHSYGFVPLETKAGLEAFEQILELGLEQAVVLSGDEERMIARLGIKASLPAEQRPQPQPEASAASGAAADEPIAIIGISGRYPMADDVEQYWDNLKSGRDCISEIPADRWDYRGYYDPEPGKDGRTYSKWGGFIRDVDKFDSLFFHITPHEARIMDPQERLFLETVWHLMEDAGYTRSAVSGQKIGVYTGVMWGHYQMQGEGGEGRSQHPSSIYASIANRVSYFFNFQGPSMALDTMCSSSITAVHLACDSIRKGECVMAVAGGVNVTIHPDKYLYLSEHRFTSSDGRCRSFGEGGDGYVPGEGVGAVLLKPLKQAEADGDYIYGVIRGSSINHGGKSSGYSVPSPAAQRSLIAETLEKSGIDARTISYIEAHGTGTSLGDPIEIAGLSQAFAPYHPERGACPIGSAKSNIGHLESAAGIAGITKVLLQLKHKQLAPSLHSERLNEAIPFGRTPFYVVQELGEWKRPITAADGITTVHPRRAGISTFGAGGSNAHIVIEEYERGSEQHPASGFAALLVLSAKDSERLREYAGRIAAFLNRQSSAGRESASYALRDIAYTLQTGREPMEERLALWTSDIREAADALDRFGKQGEAAQGLYRSGEALPWSGETGRTGPEPGSAAFELLEKWIGGGNPDWSRLYANGAGRPRRIPLPGYPFAKIRHWIERKEAQRLSSDTLGGGRFDVLHPLVHRNTSDLSEQKYTSALTTDAFYIADHRVLGEPVVPGVAILEMARAAGAMGAGTDIRRIDGIVWQEPLRIDAQSAETHIGLYMNGPDVDFQVFTDRGTNGKTVHGFGTIRLAAGESGALTVSVDERLRRCPERIGSERVYERLLARGIEYGPAMRAIAELYVGAGEAVARLELPAAAQQADADEFGLHPTLADGALQAVIGLMPEDGPEESRQFLPFHVERVDFHRKLTPVCWAIVTRREEDGDGSTFRSFDISVADEEGQVLVRLHRLTVKRIGAGADAVDFTSEPEVGLPEVEASAVGTSDEGEPDMAAYAEKLLKEVFSEETGIPTASIKAAEPLDKYGIDSVMVLSLTAKLERRFGPLSKTLLFEYRTLAALSDYLAHRHEDTLRRLSGNGERSETAVPARQKPTPALAEAAKPVRLPRRMRDDRAPQSRHEAAAEPVAIIGLAGRYPKARDVEQFWRNLRSGMDCITEIPPDRWDHAKWPGDAGSKTGVYSKWGGFIDDVDKFDPLFFQISPREAEKMDPQERLFLEVAWETLEDGAYTRSRLGDETVGVFVGAMYGHYQLFGAEALAEGVLADVNSSFASIANRVSYTLDLHGPSLTVDTMCSSSLYSVHLACESIRRGGCSLALAGGVNVTIHPSKYVLLSEGKFASSEGKCRSFGEGGDGYVPGEGAGALLLKPLGKAIADGDRVYGVIRGTAVNHGGRTNGYTVPNPGAQSDVIAAALAGSGIDPETIGYIEAHGTGTSLGDPIEVGGLTQAFGAYTQSKQFCSIGSVKSNIGHLESAAGIAALTKVLLQMKHGELVPSLHAERINPNIDFASTPFYVQRSLEQWPRLLAADAGANGAARELPRRAGVSSFGAGGANAHIIVEEYVQENGGAWGREAENEPQLIMLSAKNDERLALYAAKLADDLDGRLNGPESERYTLRAIACTLRLGREEMNARLAVCAHSVGELLEELRLFSQGRPGQWIAGNTETGEGTTDRLLEGPEWAQFTQYLITSRNWLKLGQAWASGASVDWRLLHRELPIETVSLATYPFAKERYWLEAGGNRTFGMNGAGRFMSLLHPLLDRNDSSFDELCFEKTFRGGEFYLDGHRYDGIPTLPGAVYVEMAQAAFSLATRRQNAGVRLEELAWHRPFKLEEKERSLRIALLPEGDDVRFEAYEESPDFGAAIVYCSGRFAQSADEDGSPAVSLDIQAVRGRCSEIGCLSGEAFYSLFEPAGLHYGGAMRPVKEVWRGDGEALARLELDRGQEQAGGYKLHPAMLDGALQAAAAAIPNDGGLAVRLPYSVDGIDIAGPLPSACYAYVSESDSGADDGRHDGDYRCTILLTDTNGQVLVRMEGVVFRMVRQSASKAGTQPLLFRPVWVRTEPEPVREPLEEESVLLLVRRGIEPQAERVFGGAAIVYPGSGFASFERNRYEIDPSNPEDYKKLLERLMSQGPLPSRIVHLWSEPEGPTNRGESANEADTSISALFFLCKAYMEAKQARPLRLVYGFASGGEDTRPLHAAVGGFMHSLHKENPSFRCTSVEWREEGAPSVRTAPALLAAVRNELASEHEAVREIRYEGGSRFARGMKECGTGEWSSDGSPATIKENGVYVITGGMGGIGLIFADYLARSAPVKLALAGRSLPDSQRLNEVTQRMRAYGSEATYIQADVTKREDVRSLIRATKEAFGSIDGVIHCSGVLRDAFLLFKTKRQFEEVLAPKLNGTMYLDEETRGESLDFFVLCSSISSLFGNVGQCDYAYANRFMDAYAERRSRQVLHGRTLSVNWPLWAEGGMKVDVRLEQMLEQSMGVRPLGSAAAIAALEQGLNSRLTQILPLEGDPDRIRASIAGEEVEEPKAVQAEAAPAVLSVSSDAAARPELRTVAERYLTSLLAEVIKLPPARINVRTALESYGIDSVMIVRMNEELERAFGALPKTLLYEYQTIAELAAYLSEHHAQRVSVRLMPQPDSGARQAVEQTAAASESGGGASVALRPRYSARVKPPSAARKEPDLTGGDIAIIGLDGKYPMAKTLEQFWSNLAEGRDCVTEIPPDRWKVTPAFYDPDKSKPGSSYSKWGGFIDEADCFDPLFFGISPKDAKGIDPQERLFLESVWRTVEDAGYTRSSLGRYKVGVFAGVMYGHYQLFAAEEHLKGNPVTAASSFASIANRVSHFFNFKGPSIALDTMCSSSLTAIHLACESIRRGESQLAIAGGVNLSIHPNKYVLLSRGTFVSSDGRCRSFGEGGDGYVPGEGVGAVLLKPLELAEADGDRIYGVIKATAINHGGKTNGYTVPSPAAQGEVIAEALGRSGIDPRTISYIEAHGTGTPLGDPIEIAGLSKAFESYTSDKSFCAIGSLKSNIGHLESAAGIAGLTKVLLQMRHRKLVPSIHSDTINANINFSETPFCLQRSLADWEQPVMMQNGAKVRYPRRAGLSSFGAGGSNAHIIVEEYAGSDAASNGAVGAGERESLIVLSARNKDRLKQAAKQLADYLKEDGMHRGLEQTSCVPAPASKPGRTGDASGLLTELSGMIAAVTGVSTEAVDRCEAVRTYVQDGHQAGMLADYVNARTYSELSAAELVEFGSLHELAEALEPKLREVDRQTAASVTNEEAISGRQGISLHSLAYTLQTGREAMGERLAFAAADIRTVIRTLEQYVIGDGEAGGCYTGQVHEQAESAWTILDGAEGERFLRQLIDNRQLDHLARLWVEGVQIDWSRLYSDSERRPDKLPLPAYPFARERYWVDIAEKWRGGTEDRAASRLHPLVEHNESTFKQIRFTTSVSDSSAAWRGGSRNRPVLSGMAMLEMVRFAAATALEQPVYSLYDVKWARPVPYKEATGGKLTALLQASPDGARFEVMLGGADKARSVVMAQGRLKAEAGAAAQSASVETLLDWKTMLARSADAGRTGPVWSDSERYRLHACGSGEWLLEFRPSVSNDSDASSAIVPFSLLEAALQALPLLNGGSVAGDAGGHAPVTMDELLIRSEAWRSDTRFASVKLRNDGKLDLRLADGEGRVGIVANGLKTSSIEGRSTVRVNESEMTNILRRVWDGGRIEDAVHQLMGERHE